MIHKDTDNIQTLIIDGNIYEGSTIESIEVPSLDEPYWEIIFLNGAVALTSGRITVIFEPKEENTKPVRRLKVTPITKSEGDKNVS